MSEIVLSSCSDSVDKAIDEYTNPSSFSGSSDSNNSDSDSNNSDSDSSSKGNTTDKYESGVPSFLWKLFRKGLG